MLLQFLLSALLSSEEPTIIEAKLELIDISFVGRDIDVQSFEEEDHYRFIDDPRRRQEFLRIVERALDDRSIVTIRFAPLEATFSGQAQEFAYPICSITVGDSTLKLTRACKKDTPNNLTTVQTVALARGRMIAGNNSSAAVGLGAIIDDPATDEELRIMALATRAEASELNGYENSANSQDGDRQYLQALKDYQRLSTLVPDDHDYRIATAQLYEALGGYADAMEIYADMRADGGDYFTLAINQAAVERLMGQHQAALDRLDALDTHSEANLGMRFHYHRGRTHLLLGNWTAAIADFDKGIDHQPAYAWAYQYRACAHAENGDTAAALADSREALERMLDYGNAQDSVGGRFNLERFQANIDWLEGQVEVGRTAPASGLCDGLWVGADDPRERSPLLDSIQ